jgi:predicted nucleic acid-binding Zn finger protein
MTSTSIINSSNNYNTKTNVSTKLLIKTILQQLTTITNNHNDNNNNDDNDIQAQSLMLALETLVSSTLLDKALQLSSKRGAIQEYHSQPTGRICYRVVGSSGVRYRIIPGEFCSCNDFGFRTSYEMPLCKHLLAVELARIEGFMDIIKCSDQEWSDWALGKLQ